MKRSERVKREGLWPFYTLTSTYIDGGGVGEGNLCDLRTVEAWVWGG